MTGEKEVLLGKSEVGADTVRAERLETHCVEEPIVCYRWTKEPLVVTGRWIVQ